MHPFLAALRFLTIIPLPGTKGTDEASLIGCIPFIPLVGLLIGGLAALAAFALAHVAPPMVVAVVLIILLIKISGGLHMDGLSDTADGFYSSRKRERILEIMKDSRVGPMGVIAVVCLLLSKFAGICSIPPEHLWRVAALMPIAGRCLIVVQLATLPYARSEGLGLLFYRRRHRLDAVGSILLLTLCSWLLLRGPGLIAAGACLLVGVLFSFQCRRKINGATGDTLGALCELGEATVALSAAVCFYHPA